MGLLLKIELLDEDQNRCGNLGIALKVSATVRSLREPRPGV